MQEGQQQGLPVVSGACCAWGSRLSAAVVDGKDTETVLFPAEVAPVPGLDGVHEVA